MQFKRIIRLIFFLVIPSFLLSATTVTIDTSKTGEPISKYIYGQFIEHLGRCIYDGIWAEMLQDRKFYYPITDDFNPWATATDPFWNTGPYQYLNASPWKVVGEAGSVIMDSVNSFTGIHSPLIKVPGNGTAAGISQDRLTLVEGKKYTGRIVLAGDQKIAPIIVQLILQNGNTIQQRIEKIGSNFETYPLQYTAPVSDENVRIEIISKGKGQFRIGTLSLMPVDNIKGWRKDVIALLKELDAPIYRWPGGNFVSGYNWMDGIGERDRRPPRKNPAWKGVEHNDVGIHEYMELMELLQSEAFIAVNTGLGTVEEVAEQVQYCNGAKETPMGAIRAQNGHPKPYQVVYWAVGNEMYGSWQLGHMPLSEYVKKHNRVAESMWKIDPDIKLIAVGDVGKWDETMLPVCADYMNLISEHIYCKEMKDVMEHTAQLRQQIKFKADAHRQYRVEMDALKGKDIRIAMDEWNYWYGDYLYGELGVRYHHKDALGVAMGLHEYFRNSDLYFMANYAQTVNVIGCIKTTATAAGFATTGLPLKLYRRHFGSIPIEVQGSTGNLDVAAALTKDRKTVTIAVVNPSDIAEQLTLDLGSIETNRSGKKWTIQHDNPEAYNEPGKTANVTIKEEAFEFTGAVLEIAPYAIVLYRLQLK
jgi:alpha-N-arabinofuranosidase